LGETLLLNKTLISGRDERPFKKGRSVAKGVLPEVKGTTPGKQKGRSSKGRPFCVGEPGGTERHGERPPPGFPAQTGNQVEHYQD